MRNLKRNQLTETSKLVRDLWRNRDTPNIAFPIIHKLNHTARTPEIDSNLLAYENYLVSLKYSQNSSASYSFAMQFKREYFDNCVRNKRRYYHV